MITGLRYLLIVCLLPMMWACYPKGAEYADDLDLVYTNYYDGYNFSTPKTYAIPDSVIKITGDVFNDPDGDKKPQFLTTNYAKAILDQIKKNMQSYGWTLVNKNANPDVVLLVSSMTTTNVYYYYDWDYWGWWYPDYYPWWGWYYPGYYYPTYVTGYRSGSVFIQMADSKSARQDDNVAIVWNCILNGLAEGSTSNITGRLQSSIDKAFTQSPYLKH